MELQTMRKRDHLILSVLTIGAFVFVNRFGNWFPFYGTESFLGIDKLEHLIVFGILGYCFGGLFPGVMNILWETKDSFLDEDKWPVIGSCGFSIPDLLVSFVAIYFGIWLSKKYPREYLKSKLRALLEKLKRGANITPNPS